MSRLLSSSLGSDLDRPLDGRYQVTDLLLADLWQRTYLAQDLRRPSQPECMILHLKPIPGMSSYRETLRQQVAQEAARLEHLGQHSQIPQFLAWFETEAGFYLVQEWVHGHPLHIELLPGQPWPLPEVLQLLQAILRPLAWIHTTGTWHGNLTPSTVIRREADGDLVLVELDALRQIQLAALGASDQLRPLVEAIAPNYQAPEQLHGNSSPASDVYAVGIIAAQALTGLAPAQFAPNLETGEHTWLAHCPPVTSPLQQDLLTVVQRMTCYDPQQRYPFGQAVLDALQAPIAVSAQPHQPLIVPEARLLPRSPSTLSSSSLSAWSSRLPEWSVGAAATVAVAIGGAHALQVAQAEHGTALLAQATEHYQAGEVARALTLVKSIPNQSRAYPAAQQSLNRWQQEWQTATQTFQAIQQAVQQRQWKQVEQLAKTMPMTTYWQQQLAPLQRQAKSALNTIAHNQLQRAYTQAQQRNFTAALTHLREIPANSAIAATVAAKAQEYTQKQTIRAKAMLQQAYDRASLRDFAGALPYLRQIPTGTPISALAQRKITEYTQKQQQQANTRLAIATQQAANQSYSTALTILHQIPLGTRLDKQIQAAIAEYTERLETQAEQQLQQAVQTAEAGSRTAALQTLGAIPIGTTSYALARSRRLEVQEQWPMADRSQSRSIINLAPGSRLREISQPK